MARRAGRVTINQMTVVALLGLLASAVTNPQPNPEQRCSRWEGTVSGNDPSVKVAATLCDQDGKITGTLRWTSDRSGTSTRALEGTRKGGSLALRDTALSGTPNPGWRFCRIDQYSLSGAGTDTLSGTYLSRPCHDRATIELHRVR
jgi:hypothetical protein